MAKWSSANSWAAWLKICVWKGPSTFSLIYLFILASLHFSSNLSRASNSPPTTIWPGEFKLHTASTLSSFAWSTRSSIVSRLVFITATIDPLPPAPCPMISPLFFTRSIPSSRENTPAAHKAVYSPRLRPRLADTLMSFGSKTLSLSSRYRLRLFKNMAT